MHEGLKPTLQVYIVIAWFLLCYGGLSWTGLNVLLRVVLKACIHLGYLVCGHKFTLCLTSIHTKCSLCEHHVLYYPYAGSENEWEAESPATDDCLVYTLLSRPLPDYALQHTFSQFGQVVYVRLQRDTRFGIVKFTSPTSARAALEALNGTNICGEALAVSLVDPLQSFRITKRPRVTE